MVFFDCVFIAGISTSDVFRVSYINVQSHIIILEILFKLAERPLFLVNIIIAPFAAKHTLPVDRSASKNCQGLPNNLYQLHTDKRLSLLVREAA